MNSQSEGRMLRGGKDMMYKASITMIFPPPYLVKVRKEIKEIVDKIQIKNS
jgi:hypothetical protein